MAPPPLVRDGGGWLNPEAPALFARFCSKAAKALASDMAFAFTINEPQVMKTFRAIDASATYSKSAPSSSRRPTRQRRGPRLGALCDHELPDIDA